MDWFEGKSTPETIDFPTIHIRGFPVKFPVKTNPLILVFNGSIKVCLKIGVQSNPIKVIYRSPNGWFLYHLSKLYPIKLQLIPLNTYGPLSLKVIQGH